MVHLYDDTNSDKPSLTKKHSCGQFDFTLIILEKSMKKSFPLSFCFLFLG